MKRFSLYLMIILLSVAFGCQPSEDNGKDLTLAEAKAIAKEAYVYGFPMVVNYKTMYLYVLDEDSPEYKGPFNHLGCVARVYTPADKAIVTPNSDTPYCMFWVDLRTEPVVISVPGMAPERFYHFQLIDLYTHNFSYIGTLTTGNGVGEFLIAGPDWKEEKPAGIKDVIHCETGIFFCVVRTQLFGPEDIENVKNIQDSYGLRTLSSYLGEDAPPTVHAVEFPVWKEGEQFNAGAFEYIDFMLSLVKPVPEEKELNKRFARIGLGTGEKFDISRFSPEIREALENGVKEGFKSIEEILVKEGSDPLASAKIFGTRKFLKESAAKNYNFPDFYLLRAAAAHMGLYGNSGAEAIYPTYLIDDDGEPLDASKHDYTLTFPEEGFPPVKAFWSLTMYDGKTQLLIDNPLDRYLVNSPMMDRFEKDGDGTIIFHIRNESPGKEKESNWLPAPDGSFYMVLRLYGPEQEALEGRWTPPAVQKVK